MSEQTPISAENKNIAIDIYKSISGMTIESKRDILIHLNTTFRHDTLAKVKSLRLEADKLEGLTR